MSQTPHARQGSPTPLTARVPPGVLTRARNDPGPGGRAGHLNGLCAKRYLCGTASQASGLTACAPWGTNSHTPAARVPKEVGPGPQWSRARQRGGPSGAGQAGERHSRRPLAVRRQAEVRPAETGSDPPEQQSRGTEGRGPGRSQGSWRTPARRWASGAGAPKGELVGASHIQSSRADAGVGQAGAGPVRVQGCRQLTRPDRPDAAGRATGPIQRGTRAQSG